MFSSLDALTYVMRSELGFAPSEIRRDLARYGAARCERCLFKTLHDMEDGGIHTPKGWFLATLARQEEWTAEDLAHFQEWAELRLSRGAAAPAGLAAVAHVDPEAEWLEQRYQRGKEAAG